MSSRTSFSTKALALAACAAMAVSQASASDFNRDIFWKFTPEAEGASASRAAALVTPGFMGSAVGSVSEALVDLYGHPAHAETDGHAAAWTRGIGETEAYTDTDAEFYVEEPYSYGDWYDYGGYGGGDANADFDASSHGPELVAAMGAQGTVVAEPNGRSFSFGESRGLGAFNGGELRTGSGFLSSIIDG